MKQTLTNVARLMRMLRECMPLFGAATAVTAIAQLALIGVTVTSVWISTQFIIDPESTLSGLFALLFSLVAAQAIATLFEVWWSHEVAYRILHTFRTHIYAAIKRIAPLGMQGRRTGDVASAAMNDAEQLEWFYAHTASTAICAAACPAIPITLLTVMVGPLGLVMIIPIIMMIALPLALLGIQRAQGARLRSLLVELRVAVLDSIQGQRELHSLGMVARQHEQIRLLTEQIQQTMNRQAMRKAWESACSAMSTAAGSTFLLVVLTGRVLDGDFGYRLLPVAIVLAGLSTTPVLTLTAMLSRIGEVGACAERVTTILDATDPIPAEPDRLLTKEPGHDGTLLAEEVQFAYGTRQVLDGISLTASPFRSIALVGESGAGKTTFAHLAMRFLDPQHGHLDFDGLDLRGYQPDDYRKHLALVPQQCHVFAGTIRSNLSLARRDASDAEIWRALEAANIDAFVTSLGGLDARVGDRGTTLSGGERQRIGIARAFLRDPRLLVLDEPLANTDPFLEAAIADNIRTLRDRRTTIVIAHRLASIRIADHIVMLGNGVIRARGTHEELLANPDYCRLLGDQIPSQPGK